MSRLLSFDYNDVYEPPAPVIPIAVDGYDASKPPIITTPRYPQGFLPFTHAQSSWNPA